MRKSKAATREDLLDAAERVLLREGLEGLSLAKVTAEAGVNGAAVNYTFGSKAVLLQVLLHRLLQPVTEARVRRIEMLVSSGKRDIVELTRAFVDPLLELHQNLGALFFELVLRPAAAGAGSWRARDEGIALQQIGVNELAPGLERFVEALVPLVPHRSHSELRSRVGFTLGAVNFFATHLAGSGQSTAADREDLVLFVAAGLAA